MVEFLEQREVAINLYTGSILLVVEAIIIIVLVPLAIQMYESYRWKPMALKMMDSLIYHSILCSEEVIKINEQFKSSDNLNDTDVIDTLTDLGDNIFDTIYRLDGVVSAYFFRVDYKYAKEIADCRAYISGYAETMRTVPKYESGALEFRLNIIHEFGIKIDEFMLHLGKKFGVGHPNKEKINAMLTLYPMGGPENYVLFDFPNLSLGIMRNRFERLYKIGVFTEIVQNIRSARPA